jgi:hypothetical protein
MGDAAEQPRQCAAPAWERDAGSERLEEAIAAYRGALEVYTRGRLR